MRVIFCTVPDPELGRRIARELVEAGLAACVQLDDSPIESCYRWQGELSTDREYRLVVKTSDGRVDAVRARISELHSYTVPQIVDLPADANEPYRRWLEELCGP